MNSIANVGMELKLYFRSMKRTNLWIAIIISFLFVVVYQIYNITTQPFFDAYPLKWDYFQAIDSAMGLSIFFYLASSTLISEEREFGSWDILKSMRIRKLSLIAGKVVWVQLLSLFMLSMSIVIMWGFLSFSTKGLGLELVAQVISILMIYWVATLIVNLQGILISSFFSRRISSAIVAVAFSVLVSSISGSTLGSGPVINSPEPPISGAYTNIPLTDKVLILLSPYYYNGYVAQLNGVSSMTISFGSNNVQLYVPFIFGPHSYGYLIAIVISVLLLTAVITIVMKLKDDWRLLDA